MLTLYHFPSAICAQKVRVALAEKQLAWESREVLGELRSPEYLKLNPKGYVPTLVHGQDVVAESRVINEYLEDAFPDVPLLPDDPMGRARVRLWTKQIDDDLHLNIFVLTFLNFARERFLQLSPDAVAQGLPMSNPIKRQYGYDLLRSGFDAACVDQAIARLSELFRDMEAALSHSPWLAGDRYSLADVDFTPYVRRAEDLGLWSLLEPAHPNVAGWFARVRERPSYKTALEDWVTPEEQQRLSRAAAVSTPHLSRRIEAIALSR